MEVERAFHKPPHERLANSLDLLRPTLRDGIYRSGQIPSRDFARIQRAGYLAEIIKGWYHVATPGVPSGVTLWQGHFWPFVRQYLDERYGVDYCLAPESSLLIHAGLTRVPKQMLVLTGRPSGNRLDLPHGHSIVAYQERSGLPQGVAIVDGLRVMSLDLALSRASEGFFRSHPLEAAALLANVRDPSGVLRHLIGRGATVFAGRVAGSFRHVGRGDVADRVLRAAAAADLEVVETNPFDRPIPSLGRSREPSPQVTRLKLMWADMREKVVQAFPTEPGTPADPKAYLASMRALQTLDAYHSLSIEEYKVDEALIKRVRSNAFDPKKVAADQERANALAARGYYEAFQEVAEVVEGILQGADPSDAVRGAHHEWHRALFQPAVLAGIQEPMDLAGYRGHQVYINGSDHVPLPPCAVVDAMDTLFDLLAEEPHAAVRAVLGHFVFVFIHPYGDGNGRIGRFLMNAMFASGGYPWTVVHVDERDAYMVPLERASTMGEIGGFADFLTRQMLRTTTESESGLARG